MVVCRGVRHKLGGFRKVAGFLKKRRKDWLTFYYNVLETFENVVLTVSRQVMSLLI